MGGSCFSSRYVSTDNAPLWGEAPTQAVDLIKVIWQFYIHSEMMLQCSLKLSYYKKGLIKSVLFFCLNNLSNEQLIFCTKYQLFFFFFLYNSNINILYKPITKSKVR